MLLTSVVVLILAGVGIAAVAGPSIRDSIATRRDEAKRTEVRTETVATRSLIETIAAPGEVRPLTRVPIAAEVSARIVELPVDEGDAVKRGDFVGRLDDSQLAASLAAAEAAADGRRAGIEAERVRLTGLRSRLDYATRELNRFKVLSESGDVPGRDLDNAEEQVTNLTTEIAGVDHSLAQLESSLAVAMADITRAKASLSNTIIRSPLDGLITEMNVELGEVVTGSFNQPGTRLMTIADLNRMIHDAEIAESDVARVAEGQVCDVHINGYPDRVFPGTVRQIALQRTTSPDGRGYFRAEIELDLQGVEVRSGHLANADIRIAEHEGLAVPYQAIVSVDVDDMPKSIREHPLVDPTRRTTLVVYRVEDGRTIMTPIEAGPNDLTHRIVYRGLDAGDEIISGPFSVLETLSHDLPIKYEDDGDGGGDGNGDGGGDDDNGTRDDASAGAGDSA
ncbi:MAG: efflux RND transporter periplasmic adaptor subunit [Phycisphaerales bacterium]